MNCVLVEFAVYWISFVWENSEPRGGNKKSRPEAGSAGGEFLTKFTQYKIADATVIVGLLMPLTASSDDLYDGPRYWDE